MFVPASIKVIYTTVVVVVYLTLTDPLRIQPWSQEDGSKPNRTGNMVGKEKQGKQTERNGQKNSQQRTSSTGRNTEETKIERKKNKKHKQSKRKIVETNKRQPRNTRRARKTSSSAGCAKKGSPISSGTQPLKENKGKGNECDTQRNKNTEKEGKGDRNIPI